MSTWSTHPKFCRNFSVLALRWESGLSTTALSPCLLWHERRTQCFWTYFCKIWALIIPAYISRRGEHTAPGTNFCPAQKLPSRASKLSLKFNCFPSHLHIRPWKNSHCVTSAPLPGGVTRRLTHNGDGKVVAQMLTEKTEARKWVYLQPLWLQHWTM